MPKSSFLLAVSLGLLIASQSVAADFSENPKRSFFIGFDLGAALQPGRDARSPRDNWGKTPEAVSLGAFLFGIYGGYRFNENIGLEAGWHEQQHDTHPEWGGAAYFRLFHAALRLAWPTGSRLTPLFRLGPALGGFTYGGISSDFGDVNSTFIVGALAGLSFEYEFTLGVVGIFEVSYIPGYRYGMDHILVLEEHTPAVDGGYDIKIISEKDFSEGQGVNVVWLSAGFQFEWTFR